MLKNNGEKILVNDQMICVSWDIPIRIAVIAETKEQAVSYFKRMIGAESMQCNTQKGNNIIYTSPIEDEHLNGNRYKIKNIVRQFRDSELDSLEKYNEGKEQVAYQKGLNDAWEIARKLYLASPLGLSCTEYYEIFNSTSLLEIFKTYTPQQVLAKFKAYEEKKTAENQKIRIGDEAASKINPNITIIVTKVYTERDGCDEITGVINKSDDIHNPVGSIHSHSYAVLWEKTGKHYDEIEKLFNPDSQEKT